MAYLDQMRITVKTLGTVPPLEIPESTKSGLLEAFRIVGSIPKLEELPLIIRPERPAR